MPDADDLLVVGRPSQPPDGGLASSPGTAPERAEPDLAPFPPAEPSPATRRYPSSEWEDPPPRLARDYPHFRDEAASSRHSTVPGTSARLERRGPGGPRTHKIVDGDTLRALAQLYLGDADRAWEIYEANRSVLPSAELLPIGAELTIPPRVKPEPIPSPAKPPQERGLVPVLRPR